MVEISIDKGRVAFDVQSFEKAGSHANRASVMAAMRQVKDFTDNGIVAPLTPTDKQGGVKCYVLWTFHNGQFQRVDEPATGYRCDGRFLPTNG